MDSKLDLTPFGFTPTESVVYVALLSSGPSSGYAIAKRLGIARANAYQALDGLTTKEAAHITGDRPKKYRATKPDAVLARVVDRQARQLDRLEEQVRQSPTSDTDDVVIVEGERSILDLAMRMAARQTGLVWCVGKAPMITSLAPAWRRRDTDGKTTMIWVIGDEAVESVQLQGHIAQPDVHRLFGRDVFLLAGTTAAMAAHFTSNTAQGVWSSDPALVGSVKGSISSLTGARTDSWLAS